MRVQNLSWKHHLTKQHIYQNNPPASSIVKARRVQFAGHCCRAENEIIPTLLLWKPASQSRRGHKLTYPDVISRDTGIQQQDLCRAMMDFELWGDIVKSIVLTKIEQWCWWSATEMFQALLWKKLPLCPFWPKTSKIGLFSATCLMQMWRHTQDQNTAVM